MNKYLGFKSRTKNEGKISEERIIEVYIFTNPKLVEYDNGFIGVGPVVEKIVVESRINVGETFALFPENKVKRKQDYEYWKKIREYPFQKQENLGILAGIGFHKDCLFNINTDTNLSDLCKKIGIERMELSQLLNISTT